MKGFRLAAVTAALVAPLGARVQMKSFSPAAAALAVLLAVAGLAAVGPTSAASALTSGPESFTGFLIVTGVSGERVELASNIRARGVFDGVGKIVELPPQPGDPEKMD